MNYDVLSVLMWEESERCVTSLNGVCHLFPHEEILWGGTDLDSNQSHLL